MPGEHALLSPSGAKKWINCPGSVEMESHIEEKPSTYADEGTTAHALAELKINKELKRITNAVYGRKVKKLEIDPDMDEYTDAYRDYVMERYADAKKLSENAEIYIEKRLDLSEWAPESFGTADVIIASAGRMELIDLKYGRGVKVDANQNPQLMLYALGALNEYDYIHDIKDVITTIYQPRMDHIDTAFYQPEDLREWGEKTVKPQAEKAYQQMKEYKCGAHCDEGFCKARPVCLAYNDNKLELARYEFKHPNLLSIDDISWILDQVDSIAKWATLVKDYALDQAANHGVKIPGYKLVEGRSNRSWAEAEETIGGEIVKMGFDVDEVMPRKLITITAAEKLVGKKEFKEKIEKYTVKPQGKPTLVPIADKRPEFNDAVKDFEEYIKED